jgi:hypothetical protein
MYIKVTLSLKHHRQSVSGHYQHRNPPGVSPGGVEVEGVEPAGSVS